MSESGHRGNRHPGEGRGKYLTTPGKEPWPALFFFESHSRLNITGDGIYHLSGYDTGNIPICVASSRVHLVCSSGPCSCFFVGRHSHITPILTFKITGHRLNYPSNFERVSVRWLNRQTLFLKLEEVSCQYMEAKQQTEGAKFLSDLPVLHTINIIDLQESHYRLSPPVPYAVTLHSGT